MTSQGAQVKPDKQPAPAEAYDDEKAKLLSDLDKFAWLLDESVR